MDREHFATINFARTASRDLRYESILVKVTDPNILEHLQFQSFIIVKWY